MGSRGARTALLAATVVALATAGSAYAQGTERGIDPNQGRSLVEVICQQGGGDRAAARGRVVRHRLQRAYLRHERGTAAVTVTVFGGTEELDALEAAGYSSADDRGPGHVARPRRGPAGGRERPRSPRKRRRSRRAPPRWRRAGDIIVLRVDYFENYAGRFLSVEAKDGTRGTSTTGASLAVSWNTGGATAIDQGPRTMNVNIDPDTTPDTYIEHRILVKVGDVGAATPARRR